MIVQGTYTTSAVGMDQEAEISDNVLLTGSALGVGTEWRLYAVSQSREGSWYTEYVVIEWPTFGGPVIGNRSVYHELVRAPKENISFYSDDDNDQLGDWKAFDTAMHYIVRQASDSLLSETVVNS